MFDLAKARMKNDEDKVILDQLRDLVEVVEEEVYETQPRYLDTMFFPNEDNVDKLIKYIMKAKKSLRIAVFNFTNNNIRNAVMDKWNDGVDVQIIHDDECMKNKGNDIQWLSDRGIPVRTDNDERAHMHNKFVIIDEKILITGSFNWTVQAGTSNQENLLVLDHQFYVQEYTTEFARLWKQFKGQEVEHHEPVEEKRHYKGGHHQGGNRSKQGGGSKKVYQKKQRN